MAPHRVHIRHPQERVLPGVADWLSQIRTALATEPAWTDWEVVSEEYDQRSGFNVQSVADRVAHVPGPILLIEPVQSRARELLRERLRMTTPVLSETVGCPEDLRARVERARELFLAFRPMLPRRFVAAVLIVRKLERGHYWGGKDKGYLWADDLAKGRGVDDSFADIVPDVANDLLLKGVLIRKPSGGKSKYALNPDRRSAVHRIARCRATQDFPADEEPLRRLRDSLVKDRAEADASLLDDPPP
jgi:hypothetical protein